MERYAIERTCGEGSFAVVYQARLLAEGSKVAIKKIKQPQSSWQGCLKLRELRALKTMGAHPNIVRLKELLLEKQSLFFVFEFLECNLAQLLTRSAALDDARVARLSRMLLEGLGHMHANGFMHRDIKPENVLCDAHGSILKLADMGLAREVRSTPPYTDYIATRWYRAPENVLKALAYGTGVDVWALGCVTVEMMLGRPLLPGTSDMDMLSRMCQVACGCMWEAVPVLPEPDTGPTQYGPADPAWLEA